jgi:hypothetical protein
VTDRSAICLTRPPLLKLLFCAKPSLIIKKLNKELQFKFISNLFDDRATHGPAIPSDNKGPAQSKLRQGNAKKKRKEIMKIKE